LRVAARNVHLDIVRCLVNELGADVNQAGIFHADDDYGMNALHTAALHGHLDLVRCLLGELNADVDMEPSSGGNALFFAAIEGSLDVVRCLVREFGADINYIDPVGDTALMAAARAKHAALTKWLVKAGADPQARNANNENAADFSRMVGASPEQTAYLQAKAHCAFPGCSGAGTKKCQGCMQGRYCGPACHMAHWPAHMVECRRLGAALTRAQEEDGE
jgi:ankyrin repeat protein